MDKLSYALGHNIGHQLIGMGLKDSLNVEDFAAAIADVLLGRQPKMSHEEVHQVLEHYFAELEENSKSASRPKPPSVEKPPAAKARPSSTETSCAPK